MNRSDYNIKNIEDFFSAIKPIAAAYRQPTFSYFAIKQNDKFHLVRGLLRMEAVFSVSAMGHFQSENMCAGRFNLADLGFTASQFIEKILDGAVPTPKNELVFSGDRDGLNTYFLPLDPAALQNQMRVTTLSFKGSSISALLQQPRLDWELKAASIPYDSVQELMAEYLVGAINVDHHANLEVMAFNVAAMDVSSSISGEEAHLALQLAYGLDQEKVAIHFRGLSQDGPVKRGVIVGGDLKWTDTGVFQLGAVDFKVSQGAILQCTAVYNQLAVSFRWVGDPSFSANIRYVLFESVDRQLNKIQEILNREQIRNNARDFESVIAWLLWMLGFSVSHLNIPNLSDAPDLLGVTPNGHVVIVECTTGLLSQNDKLRKLQARYQDFRRRLDASGNSYAKILPIIATIKARDDVAVDIEQAERHGILVVTQEDIRIALDQRIKSRVNPDLLFTQGEQQRDAALAKYR